MAFAAASAFFQRTGDVELRGLEGGNDAEKNSGKRGDTESECQNAIIDPNVLESRRAFGQHRHQHVG